jgi:predicted RNA-binding Zn ribbon-like protein
MVLVSELSLAGVVALVNGWGTVPRAEAGEQELPYPDLKEVPKLFAPGTGAGLRSTALVAVADHLYPVFAAATPSQRVRRTTMLLKETGIRPTLRTGPHGVRADWTVDHPGDALVAAAAVTLRQHLADNNGERLGICTAVRCADVYVDASPVGHRRYCSITCQNRTRVAAFRRRTLNAR